MPNFSDATDSIADLIQDTFGIPSPPPPPPTAGPRLTSAPTISSTPTPGQGIAADTRGRLPVGVAAQALPLLAADPVNPTVGQVWMRTSGSLCFRLTATSTVRVFLS